MSLSKKVQALLMLGSVVTVASFVLPTHAQGTDTTDLSLELTAGTRTITAPATATLSAVEISAGNLAARTSTGNINDVTITDLTGSLSGWAADVKFTNLTGSIDIGGTPTTKYILLASDVTANFGSAAKYLKVTPSGQTTVSGNSSNLTTPTSEVTVTALSALDNTGESNTFALISAASGAGNGTYTVDTTVNLEIPLNGLYPAPSNIALGATTYTGTATYAVS